MLRRNKIVNNNYDVKSINERRYSDPYKDYDWDEDGIPGEYVYGDGEWSDPEYGDELWKKTKVPGYWVSDYGRVYSEYTKKFIHGSPIGETGHIDLKTGNTYIFKGQTEAARKLCLSISSISCILSGKIYQSKGYTFEYIDEEDDDYDR